MKPPAPYLPAAAPALSDTDQEALTDLYVRGTPANTLRTYERDLLYVSAGKVVLFGATLDLRVAASGYVRKLDSIQSRQCGSERFVPEDLPDAAFDTLVIMVDHVVHKLGLVRCNLAKQPIRLSVLFAARFSAAFVLLLPTTLSKTSFEESVLAMKLVAAERLSRSDSYRQGVF